MPVKIAWAKHLYNAYNSVSTGENVYDRSGNLLGTSDGCYTRPNDKSAGQVCLIRNGKYVWISGNVEKKENGWELKEK
jgi:hypothetical protein